MKSLRILVTLLLLPLVASAVPIKILRSTDEAPDTGNQTFENFRPIGFDEANNFYFSGPGRGINTTGIWKITPGGDPTLVVSTGDPGPAAQGISTYSSFVQGNGIAPDGALVVSTSSDAGPQNFLLGSGSPASFQFALKQGRREDGRTGDTFRSLKYLSLQSNGFLATIVDQHRITPGDLSSPHSIISGTPGATTLDLTEKEDSPAGSTYKTIDQSSLFTASDNSYTFKAELQSGLDAVFIKPEGLPVQQLFLRFDTLPGSDYTLNTLRDYSRAPGGYVAIAASTSSPSDPNPTHRVQGGTIASFEPIDVPDSLLSHDSISTRNVAKVTAFDIGTFFFYSYEYFNTGDPSRSQGSALVRSIGNPAEVEVIAHVDQPAPGMPEGFRFDSFFPKTNTRSGGTVAFVARASNGATTHEALYISHPGSPLRFVSKVGDPYEIEPGITANIDGYDFRDSLISQFEPNVISPDGSVLYSVDLSPGDFFDVIIDYATPPPGGSDQSYSEWATANSIGDPTGDDDGDGVVNLLEFVLAGDASDPQDDPLPTITPTVVTLTRNTAIRDTTLILETSTNLCSWSSTFLTLTDTIAGPGDTETLTYTVPEGTPSLHVRVRAILTSP